MVVDHEGGNRKVYYYYYYYYYRPPVSKAMLMWGREVMGNGGKIFSLRAVQKLES